MTTVSSLASTNRSARRQASKHVQAVYEMHIKSNMLIFGVSTQYCVRCDHGQDRS